MPIWGVDIHPRYQAGINIEQIRREGFDFLACKLSEGRNITFGPAGSADWLRRGRACGLLCMGYHYLRAGDEDTQARLFAGALRAAGVPGMLDAEEGAGDIGNIRAMLEGCRRHGADVRLLYLPRWYWDKIGRPDLRGLPRLWASRYVTGSDYASRLYQRHNPAGWELYGGLPVEVLQFSDRGRVAGREIDVNAYRGTREEFAVLIGLAAPPTKEEETMPTAREIADAILDTPIKRKGDTQNPDREPTTVRALCEWRDHADVLGRLASDEAAAVHAGPTAEEIRTIVREELAATHPAPDTGA